MRKWIPLLIVALASLSSAAVYSRLPETMPTHWNLSGEIDGWSGRMFGAWIVPLIIAAVWGIMRLLPRVDPRRASFDRFGPTYDAIIVLVMAFLLGLHVVVLRTALGSPMQMERLTPLGMGVMMILVGNLLPRARPNWFVGIRTPWTLSNDRVWEKTHRLGGYLFVLGGIVIVLAALLATPLAHAVVIGTVVVCAVGALAYSYLEWRRLNASGQANAGKQAVKDISGQPIQ